MTVETQAYKTTALGNDSTTVFSFSPFVIYESGNLVVVTTDANGVETTLSEGTSSTTYSVSVTTYPGTGSITYPASGGTPLASGSSITIKRVLTLEQTLDLNNQGRYSPDLQEIAFDKATMVDLQQQEVLERAFTWPISYTGGVANEIPTPTANASKYLRINAAEDALEWTGITVTDASASDVASEDVSLSAAAAGSGSDFAREDHVHLLPTVSVAKGGTGSTTASAARTALGAAALGANTFTGLQTLDSTGVAFPTTTVTDVIDSDTMTGAAATNLSTSEAIKAYVDTQIAAISGIDSGTVAWYAANSPPTGWLECDGAAVSRTTYADLFAVTGTTFGVGDGSTTFNLPDLRGEFIRGWDNGKGTDSGRSFGTQQGNANAAHTHTISTWASPTGGVGVGYTPQASSTSAGSGGNTFYTTSSNGSESRPENVALLPCIKQ